MVKVIERATGNEYKANKIEGGYEVFTLEGEKYKKLKDSTFKKYFKLTGESAEEPKATKKAKSEPAVEVSPEKREKMIEKVRKMLALAKDNPSMEEGLAAALQAQKIMAKYNIHEEDVELEEVKDDIISVFSEQPHDSHLMGWRKQLALIVGENFRCKVYMHGKDVVFRGFTSDAKLAMDVYLSLYAIGHTLAKKEETKARKEEGTAKGIYNSFTLGFLRGIREGLGEQCTQLMVIIPKAVEEEWTEFAANFKTSKGGFNVSRVNAEVHEKGKREGKAAVKARQVEEK